MMQALTKDYKVGGCATLCFQPAAHSDLQVVEQSCCRLLKSECFELLLKTVLAIGNYLNEGSHIGEAQGFHIDTLGTLKSVKAHDRTTVLEVIIKTVKKLMRQGEGIGSKAAGPSLIAATLKEECAQLEEVMNVDIDALNKDVKGLEGRLKEVEMEQAAAEKAGQQEYVEALKAFHAQFSVRHTCFLDCFW